MKIQRIILAVMLFALTSTIAPGFSAFAQNGDETGKGDQEEVLNLLVQQFLASRGADQSDALLNEIKGHKGVTVERLEALIEGGGLYAPEPPVGSLHRSIRVGGEARSYALYVPKEYDPANAYPLVVCLHGAGFSGDAYLDRWKTRLGEKALLVCPTIERGAWWSPPAEALVLAAMRDVQSKYHIDPNLILLTGMSNGGIGTYIVGIFHAARFAAISPMAGGIPEEIFPYLKNLTATGIYVIHGSRDQVMPVTLSRDVANYLKGEGIAYTYREHDREHPRAGGHFFPREELPALVTWFREQRRNPYPTRVVSVRDRVHHDPFFWTEINEMAGEVADIQGSLFNKEEEVRVKKGLFPSLIAQVDQNRVEVKSERVRKYTLFFNKHLIDFSKPVVVITNGR
ncbi:MAG: hypothetical protein ACE5HN_11615, partial [Nitrospiria bacterium]